MDAIKEERPIAPTTERVTTSKTTNVIKGSKARELHGVERRIRGVVLVLLITVTVGAALWFTAFRPPAVSVAKVMRGSMVAEVAGTGTVTANSLVNIAPKIMGW